MTKPHAAVEPTIEADYRIADERWFKILPDLQALSDHALAHAITHLKKHTEATKTRPTSEISVLFTDDAELKTLNARWRAKDKPTDVLSFPATQMPIPDQESQNSPQYLGDIALGYETCINDAQKLSRAPAQHISHLIIHGFLHLLGYDHEEPSEADQMEALEIEILAGLGWPNPYQTAVTGEED